MSQPSLVSSSFLSMPRRFKEKSCHRESAFPVLRPDVTLQELMQRLSASERPLPRLDAPASGADAPGVYAVGNPQQALAFQVVDRGIPDIQVRQVHGIFNVGNHTLAEQFPRNGRVFVIVDPAVWRIHGAAIQGYHPAHGKTAVFLPLRARPTNENNKSVAVWSGLLTQLMEHRPTPGDVLLALGRGVVKDLVGFLACTLRRGLPYVVVATTLVAQVDAGVSAKTALNVGRLKNAAGTIYPPTAVLYDPAFLATLDRRSVRAGMAEMVKIAVMRSAPLFNILEVFGGDLLDNAFQGPAGAEMIAATLRLFVGMKWEKTNPFPGNRPASLRSFGHAFSRELEGRTRFRLVHGEAVAVEMAVAARLSCELGLLNRVDRDRLTTLLPSLGLPTSCAVEHLEAIWKVFERRFARRESFFFPLPGEHIGAGTFLARFSRDELARALQDGVSNERRCRA